MLEKLKDLINKTPLFTDVRSFLYPLAILLLALAFFVLYIMKVILGLI
jgi:hypothetical protein